MEKYCPVSHTTRIIGDFWSILIVRELLSGCKRFNQLQEIIDDLTSSTLSDRLKKLTDAGIIERKQYESIPPKVEYSLTDKGRDLSGLIREIETFSEKWESEPK
jgi:DNA-binding HxlR family transcriptional regulator